MNITNQLQFVFLEIIKHLVVTTKSLKVIFGMRHIYVVGWSLDSNMVEILQLLNQTG